MPLPNREIAPLSADQNKGAIVRISSVVVPESNLNLYLECVQKSETPKYEAAVGLVSLCLLQRPFVAYAELLTISVWHSEQALARFLEGQSPTNTASGDYGAIHLGARNYTILTPDERQLPAAEHVPPR